MDILYKKCSKKDNSNYIFYYITDILTKFGIINNMICNISPRGFTIFSLEDIRIKQAHMYFKDKLPFEIIIIIGKKWAILS